jgi:Domain of unknown function (DUF4124)
MHNRSLFIIIFFLTQILYLNTVHSEVFKWLDEDGKVVYGDKPKTGNAEKIKIKNAPEQDQQYIERYQKQQKLLGVLKEERDEKSTLKREAQEKNKKQQFKCAQVRKELQETKDASRIYEETDDPNNPKFISDDERKTEVGKYESYLKENC